MFGRHKKEIKRNLESCWCKSRSMCVFSLTGDLFHSWPKFLVQSDSSASEEETQTVWVGQALHSLSRLTCSTYRRPWFMAALSLMKILLVLKYAISRPSGLHVHRAKILKRSRQSLGGDLETVLEFFSPSCWAHLVNNGTHSRRSK